MNAAARVALVTLWAVVICLMVDFLTNRSWGQDRPSQIGYCEPAPQMEQKIRQTYGETMIWSGTAPLSGSQYRLYLNGESGSWSFVVVPATNLGSLMCILTGGFESRLDIGNPT